VRILLISREYPPHVYGGAGVHVEHLAAELAKLAQVEVRCFGEQDLPGNPRVRGFGGWADALREMESRPRKALDPVTVDVAIAAAKEGADVVHCHTWYADLAGVLVQQLQGIPLVITTHSLEPLRPWKAEQLGEGGYRLSSWIERTSLLNADAVIAVSGATKREILECYPLDERKVHVIYNGVLTEVFRPVDAAPVLRKYGVPEGVPYLLFVGRITRQKGVLHLVRALEHVDPRLHAVLCAGAPDTEEIGKDMEAAVRELQGKRPNVHWIREMVPVPDLVGFYSGAQVFVCPSIYEPFGIINLEAMAAGCPVVASKVGGIPEAVADGETGLLVPFESRGAPDYEPRDPARFARDLAAAVNELTGDEERRRRFGEAGRRRVEQHFAWNAIARQTMDLYRSLGRGA
jgi:starch synthase